MANSLQGVSVSGVPTPRSLLAAASICALVGCGGAAEERFALEPTAACLRTKPGVVVREYPDIPRPSLELHTGRQYLRISFHQSADEAEETRNEYADYYTDQLQLDPPPSRLALYTRGNAVIDWEVPGPHDEADRRMVEGCLTSRVTRDSAG